MTALLVLLPSDEAAPLRWLRLNGEAILDRGEGSPPSAADAERVVAVAPADMVALHWAELSGLAPAQARAAARLLVSENSIEPIEALHVAVGHEGEDRAIGAVSAQRMAAWLARLQADGLDPDAVVPAPLLLPRPEEGYVAADLGGQTVLRGRNSGFADDPALTPHIVGDAPRELLQGDALERAIVESAAAPELDLRQGPFARRRRWAIDWPLLRRLAWLAAALAALTLLLSLVLIAKYNFAAERIEGQAERIAREALPRGESGGDAIVALDSAVTRYRGGGLGFGATAGAVFSAIQATPNVELTALSFDSSGAARATIAAPGAPEANALRSAIERQGFRVSAGPFEQSGGRITGELRVTAR